MDSKSLSISKLKGTFFLLKVYESSGLVNISFSIIKKFFGKGFVNPYCTCFFISWKGGISRWFKNCNSNAGDSGDISGCKPILVLPCFSMILECLKYNCLYKYLKENNILNEKQFSFQIGYSINDVIIHLVDKIFDYF